MFANALKILIGSLCGFLFIKWFPISNSFQFETFLVELILHPLDYFMATFMFIIGFLCQASILKAGIEEIGRIWTKKPFNPVNLFVLLLAIGSFFFLWRYGKIQSYLFFCFSFIYGIISIDYKSFKINETSD
ncbi:hypothetical protein [Peribacillus tepidiphilus]|jgi:hypothetical protein|uniref:hypothetical protein n=1 Tax=Peribacillus tepidiphilus TaxID=2652445 RepID=UPI001291C394|nr:hypothetical protein [Peribacillus tepidiphilus]